MTIVSDKPSLIKIKCLHAWRYARMISVTNSLPHHQLRRQLEILPIAIASLGTRVPADLS